MSDTAYPGAFGGDLTEGDFRDLEARWITRQWAKEARLQRVDSLTGRQMFGRKRGDISAIIIPNIAPWDAGHIREYRGRLSNPELEYRTDGTVRESNKYIQPPERRNLLYFPPCIPATALQDTSLDVIITEGEFKALALRRLASHGTETLRFLPISVAGVWNYLGTVGKEVGPNGDRRDVKGVLPDFDKIACQGRRVIIAYDADCEQNSKVRAARWRLANVLIERGAKVGYLEWPIEEGKGIDDRLFKVGPDKVVADIESVQFGGWETQLLRSERGKIIPCYDNVALFLENSAEWSGVLGYDEFTGGHVIRRTPPSPVTAEVGSEIEDQFDVEVTRWLERKRLLVKPDLVRRVVDLIARRNTYHPVRHYLESLPPWDGVPRIGTWLIDYCCVESSDENPNHYAMAVGAKFLIAAVKRILEPGVKCDSMLVLEGPQGFGKSTVPRILAGDEWFTDHIADMGSKDASMQLRGVWIIELGELDALNRAELSQAKLFISQQVERFRLPYGRRNVVVPRQCVFMGTTNSDTWLKDETGGRRFWPVHCSAPIDLEGLRRDRDQLWAEALHQCRGGASWWLDDMRIIERAIDEQRGRYVEDPWHRDVIRYAAEIAESPMGRSRGGTASITEVLGRLGIDMNRRDQTAANRVSRCLRADGWTRRNVGPRDDREWRYRRPEPKL